MTDNIWNDAIVAYFEVYCPIICLASLTNIMRDLGQNIGYPGQNPNMKPTEHIAVSQPVSDLPSQSVSQLLSISHYPFYKVTNF